MATKKTGNITSKVKPKKAGSLPKNSKRGMMIPLDPREYKGFKAVKGPKKKPARGGKAGAPSYQAVAHTRANITAREKKMGRKLTDKERTETKERTYARTAERQRARQKTPKGSPRGSQGMTLLGGGRVTPKLKAAPTGSTKSVQLKSIPGNVAKAKKALTALRAKKPVMGSQGMTAGGGSTSKSSGGTRTTKTRRTARSARRR